MKKSKLKYGLIEFDQEYIKEITVLAKIVIFAGPPFAFVACMAYFKKISYEHHSNFTVFSTDLLPISFYFYLFSVIGFFILMLASSLVVPHLIGRNLENESFSGVSPKWRIIYEAVFFLKYKDSHSNRSVIFYRIVRIIIFFTPYLNFVISLCALAFFMNSPDSIIVVSFFASILVSYLIYALILTYLRFHWNSLLGAAVVLLFVVFQNIFLFIFYSVFILVVQLAMTEFHASTSLSNDTTFMSCSLLFISLSIILPAFFYFLSSIRYLILCFIVAMLIAVSFGLADLGRFALRVTGIGGGIPAAISVKQFMPDIQQTIIRKLKGCIIISGGSLIVFYEQELIKKSDFCKIHQEMKNEEQEKNKKVSIYQKSDIVEISTIDYR
ncbi:hypothetical protein [Roseicella sp. DB1501]|uniref:hypothetical protein n=1 Tax=Roseicella sp. DB1501 TaxID=2730925 RepID=UPI0014916A6D|nr:hypothetical protein [Roseicella sp. DB1501]NOG69514.1 hypothetical protein [Roseicella sp. DB1501]